MGDEVEESSDESSDDDDSDDEAARQQLREMEQRIGVIPERREDKLSKRKVIFSFFSYSEPEIGKQTIDSKQMIQFHCFCFEI